MSSILYHNVVQKSQAKIESNGISLSTKFLLISITDTYVIYSDKKFSKMKTIYSIAVVNSVGFTNFAT